MVYLKNILILSVIFTIISCTNNKNITKYKIPSWYINELNNTDDFIYGYAQAFSLKEAKLIALEDMSNKLIVQLQSSFSSNTKTSINFYEKINIKKIKQISKNIVFTNYKVIKTQNINDTFYTLLQVNKKELFNLYKSKLDTIHTKIKNSYNLSKKHSHYEQINILQSLKINITQAKEYLNILYAINNSFKEDKYLEFYLNIFNKIAYLKESISIYISSNFTLYKNQLVKFINKHNFKISQINSNVKLEFVNNISYSRIYSWHITKIRTNINIIIDNKIISSNIINSIGRSSISYKDALKSASYNFYKKLEKIGINKLLFNK